MPHVAVQIHTYCYTKAKRDETGPGQGETGIIFMTQPITTSSRSYEKVFERLTSLSATYLPRNSYDCCGRVERQAVLFETCCIA